MNYDAIFQEKLNQLNPAQRAAVETIDGPLMVVAGPGTGKTQLLSMRVANILRLTDVDPANILCLTFTEAAASNMVERLSTIIGPAAYRVEINTFHGFGSNIIGRFNDQFYNGANFKPADELTRGEIISSLIANLPFDNPLRASMDGQFTYTNDITKAIDNFKKAAIEPDELRQILAQNQALCDLVHDDIATIFAGRISVAVIEPLRALLDKIRTFAEQQPKLTFTNEPSLATLLADDLANSLAKSSLAEKATGKTKPLTAFRNRWCNKNGYTKQFYLSEEKRIEKLSTVADVYGQYLKQMTEQGLYDFADMILDVIHALENNPDLKATLQEQYQYILVDEFQDTNDAQMRLLSLLTDYDDQPNLMVVGDDDQAIYRFQGADISNILSFRRQFPSLKQINLSQNYRSAKDILTISSQVADDITSRLTNVDGSAKQLIAMRDYDARIDYIEADTAEAELQFVADQIAQLIQQGEKPADIAVIARQHNSLENLSLYLAHNDIPVTYSRQRDIFRSELIELILNLAQTVHALAVGDIKGACAYLPSVIASPAFNISEHDFYQIGLKAYAAKRDWLETIRSYNNDLAQLVTWLEQMAQASLTLPLSQMIVQLVGIKEKTEGDNADILYDSAGDRSADTSPAYRSPIFDYYFDSSQLTENALRYLTFLGDITTLLKKLREYKPNQSLKLVDMLDYVQQYRDLGLSLYSTVSFGDQNNVQLMTAHGSKGLEFKTVFVIDAESTVWGAKKHTMADKLPLSPNMPYGTVSGSDDDERRRLLFVALTRAKQNLIITAHRSKDGKEIPALEYLIDLPDLTRQTLPETSLANTITGIETTLLDRFTVLNTDLKNLLAPRLQDYHLSATDLNSFVDLSRGGPNHFLLYNLLRIPSETSGALAYGNAIHATMQRLHNYMAATGELLPLDKVIAEFQNKFDDGDLSEADAKKWRNQGVTELTNYYDKRKDTFNRQQKAEQPLKAVLPGGIRLTGKLDMMEIDHQNRTIKVVDYKTGQPIGTSFESVKSDKKLNARKYGQQLMFYKLLVENSPQYHDYRVISGALEFIEPDREDQQGNICTPSIDYSDTSTMTEFQELLTSVWNHIMHLDFPDTANLPTKDGTTLTLGTRYSDIVAFEQWLRENP